MKEHKDQRPDKAGRISAEVVLRPASDAVSPAQQIVTADRVPQLEPPPGALHRVVDRLRALGFEIVSKSPLTVSIAGPKHLFEEVFQAPPDLEPLSVPEELAADIKGVFVQQSPIHFR
jgi:hypothetical protein